MSKWLMRLNESNKLKIKKRIEKLKAEYEEYRLNYNDFPYDRYLKAMESRKAEIEELERYGDPASAKREVEDYKDELERIRAILGKVHYLAVNIDPCDQKSDANVRKLLSMTDGYSFYDDEFKERADQGVW